MSIDNSKDVGVVSVIKSIPQQKQAQYSLDVQLRELHYAANKLGLYDAADLIRDILNKK